MAIGRSKRRAPIPLGHPSEVISLTTASGRTLAVEMREPARRRAGTVILLHSMMASRRIWNSPREQGVVSALNDAGLRTLALDFRGHGDSGPGASKGSTWSYDDLVREDVPALCAAARERWPERSAHAGRPFAGRPRFARLGVDIARRARRHGALGDQHLAPERGAQSASLRQEGGDGAVLRGGHARARILPVPHARLRVRRRGRRFHGGLDRLVEARPLDQRRQAVDYRSTMGRIRIPILSIASSGDRYLCTASSAARFIKHAPAANTTFEVVRRADNGGTAPDHMQLVTTRAAASVWPRIAEFCKAP